jgi:hypothetical protein
MSDVEELELAPNPIAARFRAMADRIERNEGEVFAGAVVIIPPADGGDPVEILQLDSKPSPSEFWALIKYKADAAIHELSNNSRLATAGFRR